MSLRRAREEDLLRFRFRLLPQPELFFCPKNLRVVGTSGYFDGVFPLLPYSFRLKGRMGSHGFPKITSHHLSHWMQRDGSTWRASASLGKGLESLCSSSPGASSLVQPRFQNQPGLPINQVVFKQGLINSFLMPNKIPVSVSLFPHKLCSLTNTAYKKLSAKHQFKFDYVGPPSRFFTCSSWPAQ